MSPITEHFSELWAGLRERFGRRGAGLLLALAIEILLVLVLLTLGQRASEPQGQPTALTSFDLSGDEEQGEQEDIAETEQQQPEPTIEQAEPQEQAEKQPPVPETLATKPVPPAPEFDLNNVPRPKAPTAVVKPGVKMGPVMGPPGSAGPADTARMGTAPNGEPMYAAQWYREPYPDELAGFLQTASGPGWGLIACRTAEKFRVEDCEIVDEYPRGSNIARAVKAAAWQFQVRPPRVKGQYLVGSWVGIRIDYGQSRK